MSDWIQTKIGQEMAEMIIALAKDVIERKQYLVECEPEDFTNVLREELAKGSRYVDSYKRSGGSSIVIICEK